MTTNTQNQNTEIVTVIESKKATEAKGPIEAEKARGLFAQIKHFFKPFINHINDNSVNYIINKVRFSDYKPYDKHLKDLAEEAKKKIIEYIKNDKYIKNNTPPQFVRLDEGSVKNMLTAMVTLDEAQTINMSEFLNSEFAKKNNIKAVTLLLPGQDERRGICGSIGDNGARVYEVIEGSYQITLKWYIEERECNLKINLYEDGSVELVEYNGSAEDLKQDNVKIGKKGEAKSLYEVVGAKLIAAQQSQLENSETEPPLTPSIEECKQPKIDPHDKSSSDDSHNPESREVQQPQPENSETEPPLTPSIEECKQPKIDPHDKSSSDDSHNPESREVQQPQPENFETAPPLTPSTEECKPKIDPHDKSSSDDSHNPESREAQPSQSENELPDINVDDSNTNLHDESSSVGLVGYADDLYIGAEAWQPQSENSETPPPYTNVEALYITSLKKSIQKRLGLSK